MITNSKNSFLRFIPNLIPYRKELLLGGLCMIIYVSCWPVLAGLAGKLIPSIGEGNIPVVLNTISLALIIFLVQKLAQFGQDILLAKPALKVSQDLREDIFRKLQKVEIQSIEKLSSGDIAYRLTEDADRVGEVIYKTIQDTTPSLLQLVVIIIYMFYIDYQLSIATILLAPLISILVGKFGEKVLYAAEKSQKQVSNLAGLLGEGIQSLSLIRSFGVEDWFQKRFSKQVTLHRNARYKSLRLLALQHPVIGFIEASGILIVLGLGALRIQSNGLSGEEFSSFFAALLMLIDPISHLTTNFNELQQGQASLKRLIEIEDQPQEIENKVNTRKFNNKNGSILFKNIYFSYKEGCQIIKGLNLRITSGEIIALVGPSGSGKSTLFSLLLRFISPQEGEIQINDRLLSEIKLKDIRKEIAIVPQRSNILSGTIADAISFGRLTTKDQIINAAQIANAHEFITDLPEGYDTFIEERGTNLSGGQLQRISIARALLGNPSILLLDEATSALDSESERAVQRGLNQAMKGRTVVIIAHRLSTIQEANRIIYLEDGMISESGTHDQLINSRGKYRDLCEKQLIKDL